MDRDIILVYLEIIGKTICKESLEAITAAAQLGAVFGKRIAAVMVGDSPEQVNQVSSVVDLIIFVPSEDNYPETISNVLATLFKERKAFCAVVASTSDGKEIAVRVAARTGACYVSDVRSVSSEGSMIRSIYGGALLETVQAEMPAIVSIRPGFFDRPAAREGSVQIERENIDIPAPRCRVLEERPEPADEDNLDEADVIIAGGRGMGNAENFGKLKELADLLGGAVGGSRPAIDENWLPRNRQIGQSGKIVAPKLYIAFGISGTIQHVSGIMGSGFILAINKDPDAKIFSLADIGIVGDAAEVLPLMIAKIKEH